MPRTKQTHSKCRLLYCYENLTKSPMCPFWKQVTDSEVFPGPEQSTFHTLALWIIKLYEVGPILIHILQRTKKICGVVKSRAQGEARTRVQMCDSAAVLLTTLLGSISERAFHNLLDLGVEKKRNCKAERFISLERSKDIGWETRKKREKGGSWSGGGENRGLPSLNSKCLSDKHLMCTPVACPEFFRGRGAFS